MLIYFVISIMVYVVFMVITLKKLNRVGNILNVLGILWANVAFGYSIVSFVVDKKVLVLLGAIIHVLVALLFCYSLDYVTRRNESYLEEQGIYLGSKVYNKKIVGVLAIFLGGVGIHKFYMKKKTQGALYAMFCYTLIPGLLGIIEGIRYLVMSQEEFSFRYCNSVTMKVGTEVEGNGNKALPNASGGNVAKEIEIPFGTAQILQIGSEWKIVVANGSGSVYEFETSGKIISGVKMLGMKNKIKYGEN